MTESQILRSSQDDLENNKSNKSCKVASFEVYQLNLFWFIF